MHKGEGEGAGKVGKNGHKNAMKHENTDPQFFFLQPQEPPSKELAQNLKDPPGPPPLF
jgi:hypothetical protein